MILISRLSTILLSTVPTAKNIVNLLDSLSLHYKKTKTPILTILSLLILYILTETLSSTLLIKLLNFKL